MNNKVGAIIIEGHVQGLANARALGEEGIPVCILDTGNCIARYSKYCKKYFRCPDYKSGQLVQFLKALAKKENLEGWILIPSNDHAVYTISRSKQEINKYYKTIVPDYKDLINIYDKSKLINIAKESGIPVPRTEYYNNYDNIDSKLQFPVLIKGKEGLSFYRATGKKAFPASNKNELKNQLSII